MVDASRPAAKRRRISSSAADMQSTVNHPGSIEINVQGAHIIDHEDESTSQPSSDSSPSHSPDGRDPDYQHHKRDIRLPNHTDVVSHVAADIGGSLAKVVYFSRETDTHPPAPGIDGSSTTAAPASGGRLNFLSFETNKIDTCIAYLRQLQTKHRQSNGGTGSASQAPGSTDANTTPRPADELIVMATGGGAFKFYDRIKRQLGVDVVREDEMDCLIRGLDFFITEIPMEVFTYDEAVAGGPVQYQRARADLYPYLLVNIGSGVSMIKVSGPQQFQRIGGTSLGGGTLWGLLSLLTGSRNFDDMLAMADAGDNGAVDLLVGDIYGEGMGYEKIGLSERTIASSFGKVLKRKREAERRAEDGRGEQNGFVAKGGDGLMEKEKGEGVDVPAAEPVDDEEQDANDPLGADGRMFRPEDISRSLLYAISNNIGQISYLQSEKHNIQRIYFGGSFIRGHAQTIHTLSFAIKFWSKGEKQAFFLRHEGYLGAVGAFLKRGPGLGGWRGGSQGGG